MKMKSMFAVLLFSSLAAQWLEAGGSVAMRWPQGTLLPDENFHFSVCFTNGTPSPVEVIQSGETALARRQLQFSYGTQRRLPENLMLDRRVDWDFIMRAAPVPTVTVLAGETHEWKFFGGRIADVCTYYAATNVRCHLMVGDGTWVDSEAQPVRFLDKSLDGAGSLVFEGDYAGGRGKTYGLKVYAVSMDGETVVFSDGGQRLCRIPPGEAATYNLDADNGVFTVSLPSLPRPVKYHLNTGELEK